MIKKISGLLLVVFFLNLSYSEKKGNIVITSLQCEYSLNHLGIETQAPRLSWKQPSSERNQVQAAYKVLVSSSLEKLGGNVGDVWESGIVKSGQSIHPYKKPLNNLP